MSKNNNYKLILAVFLMLSAHFGYTNQCAFDLPPNEQKVLNGSELASDTLICQVKANGEDNYHLLNFISERNTSTVNNLVLAEGTIMSLSFATLEDNKLTFKFGEQARLGITNDSTEFIRLTCNQPN